MNTNTVNNANGKHVCTLEDEGAEDYHPDSYFILFTHVLEIWRGNPNTQIFYTSFAEIENERRAMGWLIVHPFSIIRYTWEAAQMVFLVASFIVIPLNFLFGAMIGPRLVRVGLYDSLEVVEIFCDVLYIFDVLLVFITGYVVRHKRKIIITHKAIFRHYVRSKQFCVDLIAMFSLTMFVRLYSNWASHPENIKWIFYIKLLAILKLLRIVRFLMYYRNVLEGIIRYYLVIAIAKYVLLCALCTHALTCFLVSMEQYLLVYSVYDRGAPLTVWSTRYNIIPAMDYSDMYLTGYYYVLSFLLGVQLDRSLAFIRYLRKLWLFEVAMFILLATLGCIACTILMLQVVRIITALNSPETKYYSVINQVRAFMQFKGMEQPTQNRVLSYYDYSFRKSYYREADIKENMSDGLIRDINLHSCRALLEVVPLLNELPIEVIAEVVPHLKQRVFLYKDKIIEAHGVDNCMYFICRGTVQVQTPTGREICHLQDGAYFGEIALILPNQKRVATVIAIEFCEVYQLERDDFLSCFEENSEVYKRIEQVARERRNKTILLERLHRKFMLDRTTKRRIRGVMHEATPDSSIRRTFRV